MALLIKPPVTMPLKFCPFPGRDGGLPSTAVYIVNQGLAVIAPVSHHLAAFQALYLLQDRDCVSNIVPLPFTYHQAHRVAIGIHSSMDFRACPATAVAYPVFEPPFFAPALCWCAFTMEPSKKISPNSASRLNTRKILSRTPSSIHLRKRL